MPERRSDELSALLRQLRRDAGLSGTVAAERSGVSQSSISRYERGLFVPGVEDVIALSDTYQAPPETKRRLLQLVRDLRENATLSARVIMRRGAGDIQARIGRIEASSVRIRTFCPVVVAGLLQTAGYMRTVFASGGDMPEPQQTAAIEERVKRQALLADDQHEFTYVLAEGVLRWPMGGPAVMVEQLDRIVTVSRWAHVRIGVIPWTTMADVAPMHGFDLFDERAAVVGTETATAILTSPPDVAAYAKLLGDLEGLAVFGDEARSILTDMANRYRSRSESDADS